MPKDDSRFPDLCSRVIDLQGSAAPFLSFSCGADSIAMFLRICEHGAGKFDLSQMNAYYMYFVPGIPWVEDYIEYFHEKFGLKIIQVPSPILLKSMANWLLQTPARVLGTHALRGTENEFYYLDRDHIELAVKDWLKIHDAYTAVGVKSGDSAMRRAAMVKTQGVNEKAKKWYPIWDYENSDVMKQIKRHDIKVSYDYELFGISFENMDYRFSRVVKDQCPEAWKIMTSHFPMLEASLSRYEYYHPDWKLKKGVKCQKFQGQVLEPKRSL
jgi:hypothetical protein